MTTAHRIRTLTLALLLLAPALPGASAASVDFTLDDVWRRDGNVVWFALVNRNATATNVAISLQDSSGNLVATPERFISSWSGGDRKEIYFNLISDTRSAQLLIRYEMGGEDKTTTIGVTLPEAPDGGGGGGEARVGVVRTSQNNTTLNVALQNLGTATARNILVSLEDRGVNVGAPLYRRVDQLSVDDNATVAFDLSNVNRSLSQVTVVVEYGDKEERVTVGLSDAIGGDNGNGGDGDDDGKNVTASVDLPFLEAEPGDTVRFTIAITNRDAERRLDLGVEPLPGGWRTAFFQGPARVSSLLLKADETRSIGLQVTIPSEVDRVGSQVPVVALIRNADGETLARVEMSITLHGQGELDVQVPNAFGEVAPGESASFNVTVRNTGTGVLRNVRVNTDLPYGWLVTTTPDRIYRLEAGEERTVKVIVTAPDDAGEGQRPFGVTVSATDQDDRSTTLTLDVVSPESSGVLWILLVAAVLAGMAAIIVKVRRK